MKKTCKKFIAVVMTLIMMAGITGGLGMGSLFALIDTYAAEAFSPEQKIDENIMKDENGNPVSGDGWALYKDEELVITGDVAAAEDVKMPWDEYLDEIKQVSVMDGVTAIPDGAFKGIGIDKIYIPASVKSISKNAFDLNENDIVTGVIAVYFGGAKDAWDEMNTGITIRVYSGHTHTDGEPQNVKKADCKGGYEGDCYCKQCNALSKQGKKLDPAHDWGDPEPLEGKEYINHTDEKRQWGRYCKICRIALEPGEWKEDPEIHAESQDYMEIIRSDKHCGEEGAEYKLYCHDCGRTIDTISLSEKEHVFGEEKTSPATCTENGGKYKECKYCKYEEPIATIPTTGHIYKEVTVNPTCEKPGEKRYECTNCGDVQWSETIPVHTVGYYKTEYEVITEATCKVEGKKELKCKDCGKAIIDAYGNHITQITAKDGTNHVNIKTNLKNPTCTTDGYKMVVCLDCNDTIDNKTLPAKGHKWSLTEGKSCLEGGGTATETCDNCGETRSIEVPARSKHDFETVIVPADCINEGRTYQRCKVDGCGYKGPETKTEAAKGHDLQNKSQPATCTEDGWEKDVCSVCGAEINKVDLPKTEHKNAKWQTVKEATCTTDGIEERYCPDCTETIDTRVLNKLGHNWKETTKEPTCEEEGYKCYKCDRCSEEIKGEITPALGHDWDYENAACAWNENNSAYTATLTCKRESNHTKTVSAKINEVTVSDPTCTVDGKKKVTAIFDEQDLAQKGDEKYIPILATGHNWDYENAEYNWNDDYSAYAVVKCNNENCTKKEKINGTVTPKVTKEATCTETGTTEYTTEFENKLLKAQTKPIETAALGHDIKKHDAKPSTCKEHGWNAYDTCSRCNYTTKKELPLAEHTSGSTEIVPGEHATCTKDGFHYEVVKCTVCGDELSGDRITDPKTPHRIDSYGVCLDCGRLTNTKIHIPKDTEISYYSNVNISATVDNLPNGYKFIANNPNTEGSDYEIRDGKTLNWEMSSVKDSRTFEFKVLDADNNIAKDKDGNEIKGTCDIKVKTGFFSRLIGVIRYIFGRTKTEVIKP